MYISTMGMSTGTATVENAMVLPHKVRNRVTIGPSNPSSGYLPEKVKNIYSQRYMHPLIIFEMQINCFNRDPCEPGIRSSQAVGLFERTVV